MNFMAFAFMAFASIILFNNVGILGNKIFSISSQDAIRQIALPQTAKLFQAKTGNGWCVDSEGKEGTARYFLEVGCYGAQSMCDGDSMCVAFACNSTGGKAVLYTKTDCTHACSATTWLFDPTLIHNASAESTQSRQDYAEWSSSGQCYVQSAMTSLSADAAVGDTTINVADSSIFAVGQSIRLLTEIKTITQVSAGELVMATPLDEFHQAGKKVLVVTSDR